MTFMETDVVDILKFEFKEFGNTQEDDDYSKNSAKRKRIQNRPKVLDSWDDTNTEKLICEVEARPCIWSAADPDYKYRSKRNAAWNEILTLFDSVISVEQLNAKWQTLRCQYRTTFASVQKYSDQGISKKKRWKFFSAMAFLGDAKKEQSVCGELNWSFSEDNENAPTTASGSTILEDNEEVQSTASESCITKREIKTETCIVKEVTDKREIDKVMCSGREAAVDRLQQPEQPPPDDVEIFGNYLLSNLRKIKNLKYREITQRRLLQLLWDCIDQEPAPNVPSENSAHRLNK